MLRKIRWGKNTSSLQTGQGLVEYALMIMLVGSVVILVLGLFGERVQRVYCETVLSIAPDIDAPACDNIFVSCNIISHSPFMMEAAVTDNMGDDDITRVVFYVDGAPYNTERFYKYCLQSGDGACQPYTGPRGKHKFSAVAFDAEGNSGQCSTTATVP